MNRDRPEILANGIRKAPRWGGETDGQRRGVVADDRMAIRARFHTMMRAAVAANALVLGCEPVVLGTFASEAPKRGAGMGGAGSEGGRQTAAPSLGLGGVGGAGDPPTATTDHYCLTQGETLTVSAEAGLLANDGEAGPLRARAGVRSSEGQVISVSSDGSFTYTPTAEFSGADSFIYALMDDDSGTATGLAELFVTPPFRPEDGIGGYMIELEQDEHQTVAMAGDVNGDGFDDMLISVSNPSATAPSSGRVYIVFGSKNRKGVTLGGASWSERGEGLILESAEADSALGAAVSGAGDVNGDGLADVIVGAPTFGEGAGRAYVVFGRKDFATSSIDLAALAADDDAAGFAIDAAGANSGYVGLSVAGGGDINDDGLDDVVVSAIGAEPNGFQSGRIYVVFGKQDGAAVNLETLAADDSRAGFAIDGEAAEHRAGWSTGMAGDVNDDGYDDVVIGTNMYDLAGRAYVVFGKADGAVVRLAGLGSSEPRRGLVLQTEGELLARSVDGAGDFDGDGIDDIVLGAFLAGDMNSGRAHIVFGRQHKTNLDGNAAMAITGPGELNSTGVSVAGAGDVNRDGFDDVVLWGSKQSHVVFGGPERNNIDLSQENDGSWLSVDMLQGDTYTSFDRVLVGGGSDVNADGFDDMIIRQTAENQSQVIFGGVCLHKTGLP